MEKLGTASILNHEYKSLLYMYFVRKIFKVKYFCIIDSTIVGSSVGDLAYVTYSMLCEVSRTANSRSRQLQPLNAG